MMSNSTHSLPPDSVAMDTTATIPATTTLKPSPQAKQTLTRVLSTGFSLRDSSSLVKRLNKSLLKSGQMQETSVTEAKNTPIEAWYYNPNSLEDPEEKDPTLPHHFNPDQQVPKEHLETLGVLVWTELPTRNYKENQQFQKIKTERGYNYEEVVTVAPDRLANYEQKKREFFKEHLHEHEEIRLILEGSGYEDIRDFDGHWIRIHITKGVLIVLPSGMYHRFTLDDTNYLKAVLLYQETPSRIQFDRSNAKTDIMEVREHYVTNVLSRGTSLHGNSSDLMGMLEGLDEELEKLRARQEMIEATLDESNLYADAVQVALAADLPSIDHDDVTTRLAQVAQSLQGSVSPPTSARADQELYSGLGLEIPGAQLDDTMNCP